MPSFDQRSFIAASVNSVLAQDYPNLELVVADGGSTDGTVEWLTQRASQDKRLRWESAPDSGPAQAVNRAIARARGTTLGWLNSDDLYTPAAVRSAVTALYANPEWLMVYGRGRYVNELGSPLQDYPTLPPSTPLARFSEGCFICQPTVFFQRAMWVLLGRFDETLKTAFDFDYWVRAFKAFPERIGFVDEWLAHSRLHPGCITLRERRTVILEGMQVLARHLGSAPKEWLLTYANELLQRKDGGVSLRGVKKEMEEMVERARQWLNKDDLPALQLRLGELVK